MFSFQLVECPHCKIEIHWKNADYRQGFSVECPKCKRKFNHINCPHCKASNYYKKLDYTMGMVTPCRHCKKSFQQIKCVHCRNFNMLSDNFLKYPVGPFECKTCSDIERRNTGKQRHSATRKSSDLRIDYSCVICSVNPKNAAFVPCGHVTCCESCALNIASQGGRCFMCNKPVESALKNHAL